MKERPIPFSASMVRAIQAGAKTQTRRIVKPQPPAVVQSVYRPFPAELNNWQAYGDGLIHWYGQCPYGVAGDLLYVKEAWRTTAEYNDRKPRDLPDDAPIEYLEATDYEVKWLTGRYRHARFMMRWMSRITLEVTDVRVERLQDISEADAVDEGIERAGDDWRNYGNPMDVCLRPRTSYATLWASINGPGSWDANPWVWIICFRRINAHVVD